MKNFDVIIIGGGAAGLCSAINIKKQKPSASVLILEQLSRVGKKLITTGNGRCNITNADESIAHFNSDNPSFPEFAIRKYNNDIIEDFFKSIGIIFTYDEIGRAYPYSLQASSVVDALRFSADNKGVITACDVTVNNFKKENNKFNVYTNNGVYTASALLLATGLYSGGAKLGSTGAVYRLLKEKGYNTVKVTPAIVQLKTRNDIVRQLKGIKVNANVSLFCNDDKLADEYGEVLFCDYGLSGPPIMHLSRPIERSKGNFKVLLDLMPEYDFNFLYELLFSRAEDLAYLNLDEFFTGLLNKRVGQVILKISGLKLTDKVSSLNKNVIKQIVSNIKAFSFDVITTTGFDSSQVTAGGIDTKCFWHDSMMSKKDKGLFAAGELLDVDGDCGGFNLHWAWSSAMCAADGILNYLGGVK